MVSGSRFVGFVDVVALLVVDGFVGDRILNLSVSSSSIRVVHNQK